LVILSAVTETTIFTIQMAHADSVQLKINQHSNCKSGAEFSCNNAASNVNIPP
jgi:hypothetical protein